MLKTPLYDFHIAQGAKMVPFAGYEMPVQYQGVMPEHLHTRAKSGLFDVSHMGQVIITPKSGHVGDAAKALEALVPVDIVGLQDGRQRYGFFTNEAGGILDDLMIANRGDHLFLVVNAACKQADFEHMCAHMSGSCELEMLDDRALIALQGPSSEAVLSKICPDVAAMNFMDVKILASEIGEVWISRSGYTGEDGYEISVDSQYADKLANALVTYDDVEPIGLGARDSLRLEAGLCLYGNDIDTGTTPIEAALNWAIQKVRRTGGDRTGGFLGADKILPQFEEGTSRKRVGILPQGRAPMRQGTQLFANETDRAPIGEITSGGFGPSIERPISMGYVASDYKAIDTEIFAEVRGKRLPAKVAKLPFVANNFKR